MRLALALTLGLAGPAWAHPHEFVDAALGFAFDAQGRVTEIEVEWRYDDFTSMLILSDLGLNPAATDLSADQAPELQGFDLDWMPGYDGDLWPLAGDAPVAMEPPRPGITTLEAGRVVSRHSRPLAAPVDPVATPLVVQVYDPEFYVAYTIAGAAPPNGRAGCRIRIMVADMDAAFARLAAALDELNAGGGNEEEDFPRVGRDFADELQLLCD